MSAVASFILICLSVFVFLFQTANLFATTANPKQPDKPCTPPCCKELKNTGRRIYYCGWDYYKCYVTCQLNCFTRDGELLTLICGTYEITKSPFCKYFAGYEVTSNYCLDQGVEQNCDESSADFCDNLCFNVKIETEWRCSLNAFVTQQEIYLCELVPFRGC